MAKKSRRERRLEKIKRIKDSLSDDKAKPEEVFQEKPEKGLFQFYQRNIGKLFWIPIILLIISFVVIGIQVATTGDFIHKSVSIKGGISVTAPITQELDINELQSFLEDEFGQGNIDVRILKSRGVQTGLLVDVSNSDRETITSVLEGRLGDLGDYNIEETGSSLGENFFKQIIIALIVAFIFMGIVVMIYFRTFVPSLAVILAALTDIVVTLAIVDILGIKVTAAGIAAFLMLIGYSVDTDILLTTKVLKTKEGTFMHRVKRAMNTGLTMTFTTLGAVIVGFFISESVAFQQIMLILIIGLVVDLLSTWFQNVGLLKLFLDKKNDKT